MGESAVRTSGDNNQRLIVRTGIDFEYSDVESGIDVVPDIQGYRVIGQQSVVRISHVVQFDLQLRVNLLFGVHVDEMCALVPDSKEFLRGVAIFRFVGVLVDLGEWFLSQFDFTTDIKK